MRIRYFVQIGTKNETIDYWRTKCWISKSVTTRSRKSETKIGICENQRRKNQPSNVNHSSESFCLSFDSRLSCWWIWIWNWNWNFLNLNEKEARLKAIKKFESLPPEPRVGIYSWFLLWFQSEFTSIICCSKFQLLFFSGETSTTIQIRLPNGSRVQRKFSPSHTLQVSISLHFFCFAHCVLKSDVCTSFDLSVSGWFYWGLRRSSSWWHIFHWWCNFISWRWKCDSLVHSFIWIDQQLPKEKIHQRGFWQNIATIGTRSSSSSLLTRKNSFKQLNQYFPRTLCQTIRKVHCFVLVSS